MHFRAAIGLGDIDRFPDDRVSLGSGDAYIRSGRALERLGSRAGETLEIVCPERHSFHSIAAMVRLLDVITTLWTPEKCRVFLGLWSGKKQREIAEAWHPEPISQQAVSKHARDLGEDAIRSALDLIREDIAGGS